MRGFLSLCRRWGRAVLPWVVVVATGTFMLILWGVLGWGAEQVWNQEWQRIRFSVFCDSAAVLDLQRLLRRAEFVAAWEVIPPEKGWQEVRSLLGIPDFSDVDTLLPVVCTVRFHPASLEQIRWLQVQMEQLRGVSMVAWSEEQFQKLLTLRWIGTWGWYSIGAIVGILWAAIALVALWRVRRRVGDYRVLVLFGVMPWRLRFSALFVAWAAGLVGILLGVAGWWGMWEGVRFVTTGKLSAAGELVQWVGPYRVSLGGILWWAINILLATTAGGGKFRG